MQLGTRSLLAGLILVSALAGCFGDDAPTVRSVSASGGSVSHGYDYAGETIAPGQAQLAGQVNDPENTGSVNISFQWAGSSWTVVFDQFGGPEDFKDGGIVFDIREHGDTGVSSADIPSIFAEIAAWGTATLARDGEPYPDPATGETGRWAAHLMASTTTVRGTNGQITKSDGSTPYDPASPGDATTVEDDPQALFTLTAPSGPDSARDPLTGSESFQFMGPESTQTVAVASAASSDVTVNVTAAPFQGPLGVAEGTVRVLDAEGNELASEAFQVLPDMAAEIDLQLDGVSGPLTVEVTAEGLALVDVQYAVTYDDHTFFVVTWDDYTLENVA